MNKNKELIKNGLLVINDKIIEDLGEFDEIASKYDLSEEVVHTYDKNLIMPGIISNHTHIFQSLMKGIGCNLSLEEWVTKAVFPMAMKMGEKECYHAAMLNIAEMISTGTTCFSDSHYINHVDNIGGIARALEETGMRGMLVRATQGMKFHEDVPDEIIESNEDAERKTRAFLEKYNNKLDGRMKAGVEAICELDCDAEMIKMLYGLAEEYDTRFQMHVAETFTELQINKNIEKKGIIEYLDTLGILSDRTLLIHSIWTSAKEHLIMAKRGVHVSHNPVSNSMLGDGIAPIPNMLALGINIGLGVDGAASNNNQDMFEAMKIGMLVHRANNIDAGILKPYELLEMATIKSARSLGWDNEIGSLEIGKKADIVVIDTNSIAMTPDLAPIENIVLSANGRDVNSVYIDGKLVMENRKFKTLNIEKVIKEANESAVKITKNLNLYN